MSESQRDNEVRRGPKAQRVKIDENWESAIDKALKKERPKEGWPNPEKSPGVTKNKKRRSGKSQTN